MLALVLAALRARRAQAVTLFLLTALAAASAAAAPWYVLASAESVATRHVETAPVRERVIDVRGNGPLTSIDDFTSGVDARLGLPGLTGYSGAFIDGHAASAPENAKDRRQTSSHLLYREQACEHVRVEGACPAAPGEVMLSERTARYLGLKVGDTVYYQWPEQPNKDTGLRLTGLYHPDDVASSYWTSAGTDLLAVEVPKSGPSVTEPVDDAAFVALDGLTALRPKRVTAFTDRLTSGRLFVEIAPKDMIARLAAAKRDLDNQNQTLTTDLAALAERVDRDQRLIYLGVPAGASQLLLLCWFALYLAVKYTGEQRRPDIGLLKLRGAQRRRVWRLVAGQSAVPMLAGAGLGVPIGFLAARLIAGDISAAEVAARARSGAVAAAALAVLGALLVALIAERKALASTVTELLRQVPGRRRAWRDVADLAVVVLAAVAVLQLRTRATGESAGLALLAPGLAALALALVTARVVTALAGRSAPGALRAGHPAVALTAIHLARRPGLHRLCALLIVTVALLGTTWLAWSAGATSAALRAELEVGADRVLTVQADNRFALLSAVRAADPSGRYAMATVETASNTGDPVLLVDAPRLPAVARWRPEYGTATAAQAAAALHPPGLDPVLVTGDNLVLEATLTRHVGPYTDPRNPVAVEAVLANPRGHRIVVRFGPLAPTAKRLPAPVAGCTAAPHCRLVSLRVVESTDGAAYFAGRDGIAVSVARLEQRGPARTVVEPAVLADRTRWRTTSLASAPNLVASSAPGGLVLTVAKATATAHRDAGVYPLDAPVPLGSIRVRPNDQALLGDSRAAVGAISVPERRVAVATRLPRLGDKGVLLDLEYADRVSGDFGAGDTMRVWLTADAPSGVLDALRAKGLAVVGDQTLRGVADRYTRLGPPLALRFALGTALVGLVLASGAVAVVAAVERPGRAAELAALRVQGAPARLTKRVATGGYAVLIGVSLVAGLLATLLIRAVVGDVIPFFADGWTLP